MRKELETGTMAFDWHEKHVESWVVA